MRKALFSLSGFPAPHSSLLPPRPSLFVMAPKRKLVASDQPSQSESERSADDWSPQPTGAKAQRAAGGTRAARTAAGQQATGAGKSKARARPGKMVAKSADKAPPGASPFDEEPAWVRGGDGSHSGVHPGRVRVLRDGSRACGPVVYWMSRDQRVDDNWAMMHAMHEAHSRGAPVCVAFSLVPSFLGASARHYGFMLRGLREVQARLEAMGVPFFLFRGAAEESIPAFVRACGASLLVCDFSPLRIARHWRQAVCERLAEGEKADVQAGGGEEGRADAGASASAAAVVRVGSCSASAGCVAVHEVDAHNVVPVWVATDKLEYAARTIRTKIHRHLPTFLVEYPPLPPTRPWEGEPPQQVAWDDLIADVISSCPEVPEVDWIAPGEAAALLGLHSFLSDRLAYYALQRNDPARGASALSGLSPWLHYGQLSAQRCALEARKRRKEHAKSVDSFLEELVVRRELADNFCLHQPQYDRLAGAWEWARGTLEAHKADKREVLYSAQQLEAARTHDALWNAAQLELVHYGKMHGFMRMYWAKKILEWTRTPEEALAIAIHQNDKYSMDGRDPNGYVGCMWSIAGVHDQGWGQRPVFGKIRYMNLAGCKRKFDVDGYIAYVSRMVAGVNKKAKASLAAGGTAL